MAEERQVVTPADEGTAQDHYHEPRWPAILALMAGAGLHYALPSRLSVGPDWFLPVLMFVLVAPLLASKSERAYRVARVLTFVATAALTLALIASLILLIEGIPQHRDNPAPMLRAAAFLWVTNVLVFALWYWKLDAGGPLGRDHAPRPIRSAFLFPQMAKQPPDLNWSPQFIDYLFLAFNTSTAFSPTDSAVLERWAKVCMMVQSMLSLTIIAVLAARAINVL